MADDSVHLGVADYLANQTAPVGPQLNDALQTGVQQNPDMAARIKAAARDLNVPVPAAMTDPNYVLNQHKVMQLDAPGMVLSSPKTATWMAQPDNAAVAHDDVPVLQSVEQTLKNLWGITKSVGLGMAAAPYTMAQGLNEFIDPFGDMGLAQRRTLDPKTGLFSTTAPPTQVQATASALTAKSNAAQPTAADWVQAGANSGVASLLQNAPGIGIALLTRNPELGLQIMAGQQGVQSYQEARDAGVDPASASWHAFKQYKIEGMTEQFPMEALVKDLKVGSGFVKTWAHQLVTDLPGELAATTMQNFNDWADLHPDKPFMDYVTQLPADLGTTLIATAMGTVGHTAMEQVTHAAAHHLQSQSPQFQQAQAAQQMNDQLGNLVKAAEASAVRQRDPQTFKDYVDHVTQDSPVDSVYINAHDLVDVLAKGNPEQLAEDAGVLNQMPSVVPQLEDALKSGGLVKIPTSELLAFTPETHLGQALMEHLKVDPEGFSPKEAEEFLQTQSEGLRSEVQKIIADKGQSDEFQASAERVHAQIKGQLDQVGRYTSDVNDVMAMLPTRFYATMAARTGVTPEEFAAQHQLHTQAQGVAEGSLAQPEGSPQERLMTARRALAQSYGDNPEALAAANQAARELGMPEIEQGPPVDRADIDRYIQAGGEEQSASNAPVPDPFGTTPEQRLLSSKRALNYLADEHTSPAYAEAERVFEESRQALLGGPAELEQRAPSLTTAIRHGGRLYKADTHLNALAQIEDPKERQRAALDGNNRVFVTERGKVLDRYKAADYAASFGLYRQDLNVPRGAKRGPELISEDLEPQGNGSFYQGYEPGLGFQSTLFNTVMDAKQGKASAEQWLAAIQNTPGVKKEEVEWIGLPEALKLMGAQGAVTREQVLTYIAQNGVRLEEHQLHGDAKISRDEIRSRAVDLAMEADARSQEGLTEEELEDWTSDNTWHDFLDEAESELERGEPTQYDEYQAIKGGENYREVLLALPSAQNPTLTRDFTASMGHWSVDNVLAHTRLADFTTPDGKKVLGVLEIQSDWHQKGRDKGYAQEASPEERAAAEQAFDAAVMSRNRLAEPMISGLRELLEARVTELERVRDEGRNEAERLLESRRALHETLKDEPRAAWPSTVREMSDAQAEATIRSDHAAGYVNEAKRFLGIFTPEKMGREPFAETIRSAQSVLNNDSVWKGTEHQDVLDDLRAQKEHVLDANLKVSEASQKVKQARGEGGIPNAPFKATWPALTMKRILSMAIEQGYDHVAWATGEQQADLYDMRESVGQITAWPASTMPDDTRVAVSFQTRGIADRLAEDGHGEWKDGDILMTREQLVTVMGADLGGRVYDRAMADRELDADGYFKPKMAEVFEGNDLKVGGEGHKAFYNRNLVNITNDIIKKFGGKVRVMDVANPSNAYAAAGRLDELRALRDQQHAAVKDSIAELFAEAKRLGYEGDNIWTISQKAHNDAHQMLREADAKGEPITAHEADHGKPDFNYNSDGVTPSGHLTFSPRLGDLQKLSYKIDTELNNQQQDLQATEDALADGETKQWGFEITDKMRSEDKATRPPLFQADGTRPEAKGSFNPSTNTITLLRNADLSTYLHELGHFFLETTARVASSESAPAELKDDWGKAADFMGFGGIDPAAWLALPIEARREGHEKWARGFEAYLRDGVAPTAALRGPFQRFKSWMLHVYKDLKQLNVTLTPEVTGVFDRLLGTQEEIAQAQAARGFAPVYDTKPEGMSDLEWEAYQKLGADATATAEDQLGARSIRDMRWLSNTRARIIRELSREANEMRKGVRAEVEHEVLQEPPYAAMQFLRRGLVHGEAVEGDHRFAISSLKEMYPEGSGVDFYRLGIGKYGMLGSEGLHPDQVAELFGFSSGDELVHTLLNAEPLKDRVDGLTDQRMLERYGDLSDPQAIAKAADEAIHNDVRLRFVATEANAMAKAAGRPRVMADAARDFARELVGRTKVRDLRPTRYTGAEQRASAAAARASVKGDLVLAATEKRNQLINGHAARAAYQAQQEVAKALRLFQRLQGKGAQKSIDPSYRLQIDQLLERFDLRTGTTLKAIDKRASLVKWAEQMKANGLEPAISDDLMNEAYRKSYKDMTVDELRGLVDAVKTIAHLGGLKSRLLAARGARSFQATIEATTHEVEDGAIGKPRDKLESNQTVDKIERGVRGFFVIHRKFDSLVKRLSGHNENSTLWNVLVRPKNTAADREAMVQHVSNQKLAAILKPIIADKFRQKQFIPAIKNSLSLEGRLAVALNWGNETNRQRVMDGHGWTADQVQAVLATLDRRHLEFVQNLLDHINSFRPEIEAKEMRVYGVVPPMEEAAPWTAHLADGSTMDMKGGYYPISYDPDKSAKAADYDAIKQAKQAIIGAARGYSKPGHLKARVDEVTGRPIRLQLSVAFQHLTDVIHDLSWHEYLIDARRLLGNDTLANAIRVHAGPEILAEMKRSVDAMEVGDVPAQNGFERSVNYLRSGATTAGLAWNFLTAIQQPFGLLNGTARIGPKWMGVGLKRFIGDAATMQNTAKWVYAKSEFMKMRADGGTLSREIKDVRGGIKTNLTGDALKAVLPGKAAVAVQGGLDAVEGSFYHVIGMMQQVADIPTWLGQYEKSMAYQSDEDYAIRQADQAVRDAQGSGHIGDLSGIQRGGPLMKLWTNFYSYFNVVYNQLAESVEETQLKGVKNVPALASDVMLVLILPSLFGNMLKKLATGDDWDEWAADLSKGMLSDLFGMMVGLRDIGAAVMTGADAPAGMRILGNTAKLAGKVQAGNTDDESFYKLVNAEAGIIFHYPAAQVQRTVLGLQALADGTTSNPLAILSGPPPKK